MVSSIVELARALHEDNERLKVEIVEDFVHTKPKTHKGDLLQQHRLKWCIDEIDKNNRSLVKIYNDEDRAFAEELDRINPDNMFQLFYEELKALRDSHRHLRANSMEGGGEYGSINGADSDATRSTATVVEEAVSTRFTGEEKFGKYVDMVALHERFVNLPALKGSKRIDYAEYLDTFHSNIPSCPGSSEYSDALLGYLKDFHARIHPLYPIDKIVSQIAKEYDETGLVHDGFFCGHCQKQFSKQTVMDAHLKSSKHFKKMKQVGSLIGPRFKLYQIEVFAELLNDVIAASRARVEVQQTRTYQEIDAERNEVSEEESESDNESDEEQVLYNPKNVPLGWDGKPIPYWLYKLHGLNIEYRCEICGNYAYMGPRNFERHFTEWRHVNGMKALKIPNSHHFKYVTKIEDAMTLFKKVKVLEKVREWRPDNDEEMEDKQGNVFKKKTFDDLKRQGII